MQHFGILRTSMLCWIFFFHFYLQADWETDRSLKLAQFHEYKEIYPIDLNYNHLIISILQEK